MRKNLLAVLALVLVLSFALGFISCGTEPKETETQNITNTESETEKATETETETEPETEVVYERVVLPENTYFAKMEYADNYPSQGIPAGTSSLVDAWRTVPGLEYDRGLTFVMSNRNIKRFTDYVKSSGGGKTFPILDGDYQIYLSDPEKTFIYNGAPEDEDFGTKVNGTIKEVFNGCLGSAFGSVGPYIWLGNLWSYYYENTIEPGIYTFVVYDAEGKAAAFTEYVMPYFYGYAYSEDSDAKPEDALHYDSGLFHLTDFFTDKEPVTDYDYSLAVVGDIQNMTLLYPDKLNYVYDWIVENKDEKKIEFVLSMGDITNNRTDKEWQIAQAQINKLDGVVPYNVMRGNHDDSAGLNKYFPYSKYKDVLGGAYNNKMDNTWQELVVGNEKYIIFVLDFGAKDDALNWASKIIEEHPNHKIIITTHAYLNPEGQLLTKESTHHPSYVPSSLGEEYNDPDEMWEKLIRKHKNIVMVLCGHESCNNVLMLKQKGDNGNVVTSLLIDPQAVDGRTSGSGIIVMLYFSNNGNTVTVEQYSTVKQQYFMRESQYTIDLTSAE